MFFVSGSLGRTDLADDLKMGGFVLLLFGVGTTLVGQLIAKDAAKSKPTKPFGDKDLPGTNTQPNMRKRLFLFLAIVAVLLSALSFFVAFAWAVEEGWTLPVVIARLLAIVFLGSAFFSFKLAGVKIRVW